MPYPRKSVILGIKDKPTPLWGEAITLDYTIIIPIENFETRAMLREVAGAVYWMKLYMRRCPVGTDICVLKPPCYRELII